MLLLEASTSSIRPNTKEDDTIENTDIVIWDEAPMASSYALKAVDILLRDIMNINVSFGGKIMLGNGDLPANDNDEIDLPTGCISDSNLAGEIFGKHISLEDVPNLCDRVILCPQDEHSLIVNEQVLQRLPEIEKVYSSINDIECEYGEDVCNYPTEFLNSLTPSGMPPHKLNLKAGAIVMLLRNLDVNRGFCNGTRLIMRRLHNHTVDCEVATGSNKGNRTLIPRISLIPSDTFLSFKLRGHQFSIRLSFAMTINKLQGQTFNRLGLLLPRPVFSHGQLYVAFSRVRSVGFIRLQLIEEKKNSKTKKTRNIVFHEVL
ncbi:unnamed protein product [Rotaria magnacalcarata]|uniref:ATP-dependent DNA helicase n=1 Tax=Rotaria magnacalcarata TaxID=392030 RepID=A0A8S2Y0N7_9BILA|nr:unnamed protein product [Rotaria magnacalcarata]